MKVYEAIAEACLAEGIKAVFGLMGDANMHWFGAVEQRGVQMVSVRHEGTAVAMADGYARATGALGIASTTCGPGLTQIATQLVVAARARTPMVVFVGDSSSNSHVKSPQSVDQRRFVEACEAGFQAVRSASTAGADTFAAFERARWERRPIVLSAARDLQQETFPWDWDYTPSREFLPDPQRISPAKPVIDRAADAVMEARRPVIVAGVGAMQSQASSSILALARQIGALVATTLPAKGWLNEDPFCVGISGAFSSAIAEELFAEADLLIAAGASLNYFTTEGGLLFPNARHIVIDSDSVHRESGRPDDLLVQGDADTVTFALFSSLVERGYQNEGFRTEDTRRRFVPWSGVSHPALQADVVDPREAVRVLDAYVGGSTLVVVGIGHYWAYPIQHMTASVGGFICTHQFAAIGQSLSTAIGAAVGCPDRKVVAFEGDASFMMHIQELETAVRHRVRMLVIVMNDQGLGAELHHLEAENASSLAGAELPTPNLMEVAMAFGCRGATVCSLTELKAAIADYEASEERVPFVVDLRVSRQLSEPFQKLHYGLPNAAPHQGRPSLAN